MSDIYVQSLVTYPLKSSAGIHYENIEILNQGMVGDRQFMLTKMDGTFVTGRTHPRITAIKCHYHAGDLVLSHPNTDPLVLDQNGFSSQYHSTTVWGTNLLGQGCGYTADQWVSDLLGEPLRILYFGEKSKRLVEGHNTHKVGFADGFPLLIANTESLSHLNSRLPAPVNMSIFRPNIVISGAVAWAEDEWAEIKIGDVIFAMPKPCSRCVFTTVDPATSTFDIASEPLKTLTSYRQQTENSSNVIFGENLLVVKAGEIKVGDKVEILKTKPRPKYSDNWLPAQSRFAQSLNQCNKPSSNETSMGLRCVNIIDETADVKTFQFCLDPIKASAYLPGQFITIHPEIAGKKYNRCYTLSSSPTRPNLLSITVKRVADGTVSNWLHDTFAVGSSMKTTLASGIFHLQENTRSKILLLSAGSGITPMLSMLRFITDLALDINIHFHHSAKTIADLICYQELQLLTKQRNNISLSFNFTREQENNLNSIDNLAASVISRLTSQVVTDCCPDITDRDVFVCGPDGFMESAKNICNELGLPESQYAQESFEIEHTDIVVDESKSYKVTFVQTGIEVEIAADQTVLEAAEEAGIYPDYSCMAGICGSCNSQLIKGDIHAPDARALDEEDISNGEFLPCCSYARSDLEVDL
jgi:uncharacterized protein YcbX/ferredoxin-NADP reductase